MNFKEIDSIAFSRYINGAEIDSIINFIVLEAGKCIGNGSIVSILLLDEEGLLRNGYSPQLPADYLKAIDGIRPHPQLGTCASVAATGEVVITPDFCADSKWAELKHLPLSIGFKGAWSIPIKQDGGVIGTFGIYLAHVRHPSNEELAGTALLANTVAKFLAQKKSLEKMTEGD